MNAFSRFCATVVAIVVFSVDSAATAQEAKTAPAVLKRDTPPWQIMQVTKARSENEPKVGIPGVDFGDKGAWTITVRFAEQPHDFVMTNRQMNPGGPVQTTIYDKWGQGMVFGGPTQTISRYVVNPVNARFRIVNAKRENALSSVGYRRPSEVNDLRRALYFPAAVKSSDSGLFLVDDEGRTAPLRSGVWASKPRQPGDGNAVPMKAADDRAEKEAAAAEWLAKAHQAVADGRIALARVRCRIVIDDYPMTQAATNAKQLLTKLSN